MALDRIADAAGRLVARRPGWIVLVTLLLTAGFLTALVVMPERPPSDALEADSPVARAETRMQDRLPPTGFQIPFLVFDRGGNAGGVAARPVFDDILAVEEMLRQDPTVAPYVYAHRSPLLQMEISSIWSLADTLRAVMDGDSPLTYTLGWHEAAGGPGATYTGATDAEWQDALGRLLEHELDDGTRPFARSLSQDLERRDGVWYARTLVMSVLLHHERFFADYARGPADANATTPFFEDMQFHVQDTLKANAQASGWMGLGIGIQREVEREVAASGRLIVGSFVVIGILLYLTLRNWRDFVVAFLSLPFVVVWMLGAARLARISDNQFTAMLPVLILALGVDFAIHGIRRYREERGHHPPQTSIHRSVWLLGPALLLAAFTTATAFLSNAFSDVDALGAWGLMGGFAILGALWICGVFTPALRYLWDHWRLQHGRLSAGAIASVTTRRLDEGTRLGRLAVTTARHPLPVLLLVLAITVPATVHALQIRSDFNADDFLDDDSDLIAAVTRVQEDFPDEGEPAIMLVEGDVAEPAVLVALSDAMANMRAAGYAPEPAFSLPRVVTTFMANPEENGGGYQDSDRDGIPDRASDVRSLLARALRDGVHVRIPLPPGPVVEVTPGVPAPGPLQPQYPTHIRALAYSKETVRELVHPDGDGGYDATVVYIGIPESDDFDVVRAARTDIPAHGAALWGLKGTTLSAITLTGEPYKRLAMVDAVTDSLKVSITLSVIICFLIVLIAFRDLPDAVVTIIPVLVLVAWLYGFMVLLGYSLNLVTATIAAMAIGVGIDYSIHLTERFREERAAGKAPLEAVRRAMDSSGVALLGSASTTTFGFLVLLFAPMPLFATFGLITAAMATASFLAAATILPPLLVVRERMRRRPMAAP